jgi:transposase-like protein
MGRKSLYKKKYAKDLINGMRQNPKASIERCCQAWGVVRSTYYAWIDKYPEFAKAAEIGERDYQIAFHDLMVDNATGEVRGNAGVLALMAKNILKWSDKVEIEATGPEKINRIEIEVLQDKRSEFENSEQDLLNHIEIEDGEYIEHDNKED